MRFNPEVVDLFKKLAATGAVEFINETYYHSLAFLFSPADFRKQVLQHKKLIKDLFGQTPTTATPNSSTTMTWPKPWRRWATPPF